jgi:hypothetical protein
MKIAALLVALGALGCSARAHASSALAPTGLSIKSMWKIPRRTMPDAGSMRFRMFPAEPEPQTSEPGADVAAGSPQPQRADDLEPVNPETLRTWTTKYAQFAAAHSERTSYKNLNVAPWDDKECCPNFNAYTSRTVSAAMNRILDADVDGLNVDFKTVFRTLRDGGCRVYVLGGEIRDAILGLSSLDTDVAFSCSADSVAEIVNEHPEWWADDSNRTAKKPVSTRRGSTYVNIGSGNPETGLEGKDETTSMRAPPDSKEYACNTIFWDWDVCAGNPAAKDGDADCGELTGAILDPTGDAVMDVLNKVVRIPGEPVHWEDWAADKHGSYLKLLRMWKNLVPPKNFKVEERTFRFVLSTFKLLWESQPLVIGHTTRHFFHAYAERAQKFKRRMILDLGQSFWDKYIESSFQQVQDGESTPRDLVPIELSLEDKTDLFESVALTGTVPAFQCEVISDRGNVCTTTGDIGDDEGTIGSDSSPRISNVERQKNEEARQEKVQKHKESTAKAHIAAAKARGEVHQIHLRPDRMMQPPNPSAMKSSTDAVHAQTEPATSRFRGERNEVGGNDS